MNEEKQAILFGAKISDISFTNVPVLYNILL